jgi:hypothetical protein
MLSLRIHDLDNESEMYRSEERAVQPATTFRYEFGNLGSFLNVTFMNKNKETDLIWYIRHSVPRFQIVQDPRSTSSQQRIQSSARLAVKISAPAPCYIKK